MLRRFTTVLLITTALVAPVRDARAEPITLAIAGAVGLGGIFTAGSVAAAIGTFALTTAISVGLSFAASAIKPKPPGTPLQVSGSMLDVRYGGDMPRSAILGRGGTGGQLVYTNVFSVAPGDNKGLQCVFVVGTGEHADGYPAITYNGQPCTLVDPLLPGANGKAVLHARQNNTDHIYVRWFSGRWDQAADPDLVALANPPGRWTANHRGRGVAYLSITQVYNESLQLTGVPQLLIETDGLKLYDPRKDSTNGGSGAHRWGNVATYEPSGNPAVQEYNLRRGVYVNGQLMLGMGVSPVDLIVPMYQAAANDCDLDTPLKGGGSEPRYRCSVTVLANRPHGDMLQTVTDAMAGYSLERASQFGPIAGIAQVLADITVTDDDLLVGERATFSRYQTRSAIATAIYGRFSDPAQGYATVAFPARTDAADDAAMGERLSREIDLSQVTSPSQAQRIAEIKRRDSMRQRHGAFPLSARFLAVQPGDWIAINSAQHGAFTALVTGFRLTPQHTVELTFKETASSVYSWTTAGEINAPTSGVPGQPGDRPNAVAGFAAQAITVVAEGGLAQPGLRFVWTPIGDPTVRRLLFEYRVLGSIDIGRFNAAFPASGDAVLDHSIQAATRYEARANLETDPERPTSWTAWTTVTSNPTHVVPISKAVTAGGVDFDALETLIQNKLQQGVNAEGIVLGELRPLTLALRDSVSSVQTIRVQAEQTGLINPGLFQQIDALGQLAVKLALQAERTESIAQELGAEHHGGRWVLRGVQDVNNAVNRVSIVADLNTATIALKASRTELDQAIANVAAGLQPAVGWNWNSSVEGWTVSNGTLTAGAGYVDFAATGAGAYMQSPAISVDANVYKVVRFNAVRTAGTGWGVALSWGPNYSVQQAFVIPDSPGTTSEIALDLASVPEWAGTITNLRVYLSNSTTVRFSHGQVGKYALASGLLSGLQGQITELNLELDATAGSIAAKADRVTVDGHTATLTSLSSTLDAQAGLIAQRALVVDLTAAVDRLTRAEQRIDAQNNIISFTISQVQTPALVELVGLAALHGAMSDEATRAASEALVTRAHTQLATKITDEGEVRAQAITQLNARVAQAEAVAYLEQLVRATADYSEATARQLLEASHRETVARLATEEFVRASADTAEAVARSSLAATVNTNVASLTASINSETSARVAADSAEASARQTVAAALETETSNRIAAVSSEASARAAADSAEASARQTVAAALETETSNRIAAVSSEASARVSGDDANASLINTVATNRNKVFRQAVAPTAVAVGDLWFDSDDNNKPYRWDGAIWVVTRDVVIDQNSAAIVTVDQRVSDVNGRLNGSFTVLTDVNGRVAFIRLQNNGAQSAFIISAEDVIAAGTITAPLIRAFAIEASHLNARVVNAEKIALNGVQLENLLEGAATKLTPYTSGVVSFGPTAGSPNERYNTLLGSTSITSVRGNVSLVIYINVSDTGWASNQNPIVTWLVRAAGVEVVNLAAATSYNGTNFGVITTTITAVFAVGAGTTLIELYGQRTRGGGGTQTVTSTTWSILESRS